jgi:meso-butanediol dehydrogenase/(S,S)-butanediol dehydrogenase/diacetyl reductase
MTGRLAGKTALITGTGGGQGRAAAVLFAREGARVVGCDVKTAGAAETVDMVKAAGGEMVSLAPLDLTDEADVARWIAFAVEAYGGFDILYNNASAPRFGAVETLSRVDWDYTLANEVTLIFLAVKHAVPHLRARGGGVILNTASSVGLSGAKTSPGGAAHAAAKGAVIALSNHLVGELAHLNIRVNTITPGAIDTPALAASTAIPEVRDRMTAGNAIPRMGRSEEIAYAALYLASDEAAYTTGANIIVDGGGRQGRGSNFGEFDPSKWNTPRETRA